MEDIESVFVQRIAHDGTIWWQDGGVSLYDDGLYPWPVRPKLLADGSGGAIVTWYNAWSPVGIHAQRVNANGNAPPTNAHTITPSFMLSQNYPNPFNPSTRIAFDLPRAVHVRLRVYNVKGELVSTIVDQHMTAGRKDITWNAKDNRGQAVSSGIYFYRLVAGEFVQTKKMVLLQ